MSTCTKCGTEIPPGTNGCPACGYGAKTKLVLAGKSGELSTTVDLEFGKTLGAKICGDDSRFMEDIQFFLKVDDDQWILKPYPRLQNQVFVNGGEVTTSVVLKDGDRISLKEKAAFIDVHCN